MSMLHKILIILIVNLVNAQPSSHVMHQDFEPDMPRLKQHQAGTEVKLRCGLRGHYAENLQGSEVNWHFYHCGEGHNQTSCRYIDDNMRWQKVDCDGKSCKMTLTLKHPTESNSGLYRCTVHPYKLDNQTTLEIKLVQTFQLDVINTTIAAPQLLDNLPANVTVFVDSQVVLQCRVVSKVPPSIKWFRKHDTPENSADHVNPRSIQYLENTYDLVDSAGEKDLSSDIYLSKLILNNVSLKDSGTYVCIGINYRGFQMRQAYVNVINPADSFYGEQGSSIQHFFLLFLIPLGLAVIPLIFWTCFVISKRRRRGKSEDDHIYEKVDV